MNLPKDSALLLALVLAFPALAQTTIVTQMPEVKESFGYDQLDDAATNAVKSWLIDPARANGPAVASMVEIPVRFRLVEMAKT